MDLGVSGRDTWALTRKPRTTLNLSKCGGLASCVFPRRQMGSAGPHLLTFQDKPEMQIFRNLFSCAKLAIDSDIFERPGEQKKKKKTASHCAIHKVKTLEAYLYRVIKKEVCCEEEEAVDTLNIHLFIQEVIFQHLPCIGHY